MLETSPKTPKGYVQEFIETLKAEIEELKHAKDNNLALMSGTLMESRPGYRIYRFDLEQPFTQQNNVVYRIITGSAQLDCEYVSSQNSQILLKTSHILPLGQKMELFIDRTALPEKLLQCFQENLHEVDQRYAFAARLFNGQFQTNTEQLPDLSGYSQVNEYQKAAIVRSLQGDTIIWGPPGTGKTHTIAIAVNEQIKLGRRVLLLSHANTAVDGAMEELADLLQDDPIYQEGRLVRVGSTQLEQYPMISLEGIVRAKTEGISSQLDTLKHDHALGKDRHSELSKLQRKQARYRDHQKSLSEQTVRYSAVEDEIEQYTKAIAQKRASIYALDREQQRLRSRIFQTTRTKQKILEAEQAIREAEAFCTEQTEAVRLLRDRQTALALEMEPQKEALEAEAREIAADLKAAGIAEADLEKEAEALHKRIGEMEQQIQELERQIAAARKQVIEEAAVIGATLSMAYMSADLQAQPYDVLFIDEISMAPLIPVFFAMGLVRSSCILIGDFLQLPPIGMNTKSELIKKWQDRSFFDLIGVDSVSKAMSSGFVKPLSIQYRMNPAIASVSNQLFYGGMLENGDNTRSRVLPDRWAQEQPLILVDTSREEPWMSRGTDGKGRCNLYHAALAAAIAQDYLESSAQNGREITVGVVVPYRLQKKVIGEILDEALGKDSPARKRIEVNTVHSFQGGEKDVIICDTVESEGIHTRWFSFDDNGGENKNASLMLNVAVTRAKSKFILLANAQFAQQNFKGRIFNELLDIFHRRGAVLSAFDLGIGFQVPDQDGDLDWLCSGLPAEESSYHDQNGFWAQVIQDLEGARKRVIIFCPFLQKNRIETLLPVFRTIMGAGVEVIVYTRTVREHEGFYQGTARSLIDEMRKEGIVVRTRSNMHEKVILIDDALLWQGSLNLLSHSSTTELMQRVTSKKVQQTVLEILDLDNYKRILPAKDPAMRCELCNGQLVERTGTYGTFYGCTNFPDCGFSKKTVTIGCAKGTWLSQEGRTCRVWTAGEKFSARKIDRPSQEQQKRHSRR